MPFVDWILNKQITSSPTEWGAITVLLKTIVPDKFIRKIELVSFGKKGSRESRWSLNNTHPEYSTEQEALDVAKKLTWLFLWSRGHPVIPDHLRDLLLCDETEDCKLFIGHDGRCRTEGNFFDEETKCQLCKKVIRFDDFRRGARKDASAIQIAHNTPLSRGVRGHNVRNVAWAHRSCNQIQGEQTLDETLNNLQFILEGHGYTVRR